jgi:hypothetical protein
MIGCSTTCQCFADYTTRLYVQIGHYGILNHFKPSSRHENIVPYVETVLPSLLPSVAPYRRLNCLLDGHEIRYKHFSRKIVQLAALQV